MSSPALLDFDELLAPIAGDNPAGVDLREDRAPGSPYDRIKDARATVRELEKRQERGEASDGDMRGLVPAWRTILDTAPKVIAETSKDLEITAYLIEALQRVHGLAGLRDGFRLARGLVEGFWDQLYPLPDEEGVSTRVAPLAGLNGQGADGTLIKPLRMTELTAAGNDRGPLSLDDNLRAERLLNLNAEDREQRVAAGDVSLEIFEAAVRATPADFYRELMSDLAECREEYGKLCAALDAACGSDSPPSSNIRNLLEAIHDRLSPLVAPMIAVAAPEEAAAAAEPGAAPAAGGGPAGPIGSREDALRTLSKVAEYFRRAEPHSLVSYVIEEAVRRARLPLPELLKELIPDASERQRFFIMSGLRPPEES